MIGAYVFLTARSLRNLLVFRLRRLRQPRYLVATLMGGLYFYWAIVGHRSGARAGGHGQPGHLVDALAQLPPGVAELAGALILLGVLTVAWVIPQMAGALRFSEAEVQFLFTAPLSRRSLIHYKLVRSQIYLLLGAFVASVVFSGRFAHRGNLPFLFGMWVLLVALNLHFVALGLTRTSLMEHGVSGLHRRLLALAVLVGMLVAVGWSVHAAAPAVRTAAVQGARAAVAEVVRAGHGGIMRVLLFPLRLLVRPLLAPDLHAFARLLPAALGLVALNYAWAASSQVAFEESAAEAAERRARRIERLRSGQARTVLRGGMARRPPFRLGPSGRPEVAILWKNLIAAGRIWSLRVLWILLAFLVTAVSAAGGLARGSGTLLTIIAATLALTAGLMMVMGGTLLRNDLRQDLLALDQLKCLPLSGASVVLAEVLGPVVLLTVMQWLLLAVAAALSPFGQFRGASLSLRLCALVAAMLLAPAFNLMTVMVQNAAALAFPAWVSLGQSRARGLEATGQRLINFAGTLLALVLACVPAAITAGVTVLILWPLIGAPSLPIGAAIATLTLAGEGVLGVMALGRLFERLDASNAGIH